MTKKRLLITIAVIVVMMLSVFGLVACKEPTPEEENPQTPSIEETETGDNEIPKEVTTFDFQLNEDGSAYIIAGIGSNKEIKSASIPATYNNLPVVEIGDNAFVYDGNVLTSIYVHGDNLKKIGAGAFRNNSGIRTARLGNGLVSIGESAFRNCSALTEAILPESLESIGDRAFLDCSKLSKVVIPSKITKIGDQTFMGCNALRNEFTNKEGEIEGLIVKTNKIDTIGEDAFRNCAKLADISVLFTDNLNSIGARAFMGCTDLVGKAKADDSKVKEIILPKNITKIESETFRACTKLTNIVFNSELVEIGDNAFRECKAIKALDIPAKVKVIGKKAFQGTATLATVTLHEGLEKIDDYAFAKASGNAVDENDNPIYTGLKEIVIPNSVKIIGKFAFSDCSNLEKVTFGTGIEYIAEGAFRNSGANGITYTYEGTEADWKALMSQNSIETNYAWGCKGGVVEIECSDGKVEMTFATKEPEVPAPVEPSPEEPDVQE